MRELGQTAAQPDSYSVDALTSRERVAVERDLLALADRCKSEGVLAVVSGMVAQIGFHQLEDEQSRQDLQDYIDEYRRSHPHGMPVRDSRRTPPQSNTSDDRP